jgi:hypothetical protein
MLNKQGVENELGFVVQVLSRYKIQYSDTNLKKAMTMKTDYGFNAAMEPCMILEGAKFEQWDDGVRLSSAERAEVKARFSAALEVLKIRLSQ